MFPSVCFHNFLGEMIIARSFIENFPVPDDVLLQETGSLFSEFYFRGRENILRYTANNGNHLLKVLIDTDIYGKVVIKHEDFKPATGIFRKAKTCISPDLGKLPIVLRSKLIDWLLYEGNTGKH